MEMLGCHSPCGVWIEDEEVGVCAGDQRAFAAGEASETSGFCGHPVRDALHNCFKGNIAAVQHGVHHGKREAEAGDAAPGLIEAAFFAMLHRWRAGGVVGGDHVDDALFQRGPQGIAVGPVTQGWCTLEFCCTVGNVFGCEPEVLHAGFYGDGDAALACGGEDSQSLGGGEMDDVDGSLE